LNRHSEKCVDIGDDHAISFAEYEGERSGCTIWHTRPDNGEECAGWLSFAGRAWSRAIPSAPAWTVESEDPLTLSPSVLCRACGDHGWVRNGKWVKA
jgi:hypothetical protein